MRDMDKWKAYLRGWYKLNTDRVKGYHRHYASEYPDRASNHMRVYRKGIRLEVLTHYSNGDPKCECCGENVIEFLCIDHINGGGSRQNKKTGGNIYAWLRKNEFPLGFRVLCHNCNSALGFYGYCPHKEIVNASSIN